MSKITKYSFSQLYDMASGISSTKEQAGHGSPFASFSTVFNNYFLPDTLPDLMDTSVEEQNIYSIRAGDILITRTSETIDELAMSCVATKDYPGATYSGFVKRLRPKTKGIAYHKYLAFYLRGNLFRKAVTNNAFMTLRASFNEDIFSFLNLYLPEYEEQVRIGDMLYAIEQKIHVNTQICDELETAAKTIYDYWFTQFDFPNAEGKPYRASGGKMVWNEQLKREIPEKWDVGNLYSVANPINGLACQKYRPSKGEKALPVVKIKEMHDGITAETEKVSVNIPGKNKIHDGDILFSWSATLEVMYWFGGDAGLNQHIFKVEPVNGYSKEYVYHQFAAYVVNFVKVAESRKTTMGHITTDHLEQSRIVLPPADIIQAFSRIVGPIHRQIGHCKKENRELSELRDWLLPMLMNGQATVEDAEEKVDRVLSFAPQTVEVRQAARNFGDKETDDTANLVQAYLRRKQHDSKTQKRN